MITAVYIQPAHLFDEQSPTGVAVVPRPTLQPDHPVANISHAAVRPVGVVQQQDGAFHLGEAAAHGEELPLELERIVGQRAQLCHRIEHQPHGLYLLDGLEKRGGRLVEFDLGSWENRLLGRRRVIRAEGIHFMQFDAIERPAVGARNLAQGRRRLGKGDVKPFFARFAPGE